MQPVTTRIPERDAEHLAELEEALGADRSEVLRRLIRDGITEWRKSKALEAIEEDRKTIRAAAEYVGVSYIEMLQLAAEAGLDSGYTLADLERGA